MSSFDLIVIGAGPGGYVAALDAAALGKSVALVEEREVGGTCLNRGCIPTKAMLRAAHVYHEFQQSAGLGVVSGEVAYDMSAIHRHLDEVTDQLRGGIDQLLEKAQVRLINGHGTIPRAGTVEVGGVSYSAEAIVIATGSVPAKPPIPGIDLPGVVNSDALLTNGGVDCKRLVIIGGGVVGVEFAQVYSDLGCQVTILEAMPRLLPPMERELSQNLSMIFKRRGIMLHTGAMVNEIVAAQDGSLLCRYTEKDKQQETAADAVLVCTGRTPNTKGLCGAEVELCMQRGYIPVDPCYKTAVDGIYAIGDVVLGGVQLAHAAEAAARNLISKLYVGNASKAMDPMPACVFTRPEIASVGLTADEAKEAGIAVAVRKSLTSANGKALIEGADRGFVKLIFAEDTQCLLGAQLMCPHASEMLGGLTAAIVSGMTRAQLESTIFPHPTISETIIG